MKASLKISFTVLFALILLGTFDSFAQKINVYDMIGKKLSAAISAYGKPVHQDNSDPSMRCVFYKTKSHLKIFVADKNGIYQAEATKSFGSKSSANKSLNSILRDCREKGYITDSLSVSEYQLMKKGVSMSLTLDKNNTTKKYEIRIKANKSEN